MSSSKSYSSAVAVIITLKDKGGPCEGVHEEVDRARRWQQVEDGAEDAHYSSKGRKLRGRSVC